MSTEALIKQLASELTPVRRRSGRDDALLLLLTGALELSIVLGAGLIRPDMGRMFASTYMIWKLGGLAILTVVSAAAAVQSFAPIAPRHSWSGVIGGLAVIMMMGGAVVSPGGAIDAGIAERLAPAYGMLCAASIVVMALPILGMMMLLMRRGAPTRPATSAWAAGIASGLSGAFIFAFCCPANDPLYVLVWYAAGCAVSAGLARWLMPWRYRL